MAIAQKTTPKQIRAEHFPDLDDEVMYPRLSEAKIEKFARLGTRRAFAPGETLYAQGQRDAPFLVIERGRVRVLDRKPGKDVWIAEADGGTFLGDIATFTGEPAIAECVANEQTDVISFDRSELRAMLVAWPEMAELVLRTMMARREWHAEHGYGVLRLIAPRGSRRAFEVRDLLERNLIPVRWYDVDTDPESAAMLDWLQIPREETPLLVRNTAVLRNPSAARSPASSACAPRSTASGSTWSCSAADPLGSRPPFMAGLKDCGRWWPKRGRPAGRPARALGSRTTWGSPPGSLATS